MAILSVALLILSTSHFVVGEKCYGLALEGGGTRGAYESGALLALTEFLPVAETSYRIISGISIGAINACSCAGFEVGDERNMALHVQGTWNGITSRKIIYSIWRGDLFWALFFRPAAINNAAELKYIQERTGDQIKRNISVAATNYNTSIYTNFNETLGPEYLPTACFASGAFPGAFPPVWFLDEWWCDGAVTANLNAFIAVDRCREYGFEDKDIVMDLLYDETSGGPPDLKVSNTRELMNRIVRVQKFFTTFWYISQTMNNFPDVDFRYMVVPTQPLPFPLSLDQKSIQFEISLGYNDTVNLIKLQKGERDDLKEKRRNEFLLKFKN